MSGLRRRPGGNRANVTATLPGVTAGDLLVRLTNVRGNDGSGQSG